MSATCSSNTHHTILLLFVIQAVTDNDVAAPQAKQRRTFPANSMATGCDILDLADSSTEGEVCGNDLTSVAVKTEPPGMNSVESLEGGNPDPVEMTRVNPGPCRRSTRLKQSTMLYEPVQFPPVARRGRRKGVGTFQRSVKWNRKKMYMGSPQTNVEQCSALDLLSAASRSRVVPEGAWPESPELKGVKRLNVPQTELMHELVPKPESIIRLPLSLLWPETIGLTEAKPLPVSRAHPQLQEGANLEAGAQAQLPLSQSQSTHPSPPSQTCMLQSPPIKSSSVQNTSSSSLTTPISTPTIQSQLQDKFFTSTNPPQS